MKIKNIVGLGLVLITAAFTPAAMANSITLTQNAYSFSDGGEFTAIASPGMTAGYAPQALLNGGFETFCVEAEVFFNPGVTYSFTLSNFDSEGRYISLGAAYLYYQFATGNLAGYDYVNAANRRASAGMLQAALWMLQGNQSGGASFPTGGPGNTFYNLAVANLGAPNITAANNGQYSVEIIQMWDDSGNARQNQLVLNPETSRGVPDAGLTLALLALAVGGLFTTARLIHCSERKA